MNSNAWIDDLASQVQRVRDEAVALDGVAGASSITVRLDQALRRLERGVDRPRPLHVALLGGTGVGKSCLFNALIDRTGASPVSDDVRGWTKQPHVAAAPADRPLTAIPADLKPVYVDDGLSGVVLCDTPDVDGVESQNWEVTRQVIDVCDVVVYMTNPDKRANFQIAKEVCDWAAKKRWVFVMNQMDCYASECEAIRSDFDDRLRGLGFQPDNSTRFLVSATQPGGFDFSRLRTALLTPRSQEQLMVLREDAFLGYVQDAVRLDRVETIADKVKALDGEEAKLRQAIQQSYRDGLSGSEASEAFRLVARESAWRHVVPHCGWFLAFPVLVRCRFSLVWTGYHVGRLALRGFNALQLLGLAITTVFIAIRGVLPLRQIIVALGPTYRRRVAEVRADARRILEDHGLDALVSVDESDAVDSDRQNLGPTSPKDRDIGGVTTLDNLIRSLALRDLDGEVLEQLDADVQRIGQKTGRDVMRGMPGKLVWLLGNGLPFGILAWILWRIGDAWWRAEYLHWPFYGMALALEMASLLPGFWLLAWLVKRRAESLDAGSLVEYIDQPRATASLRIAAQRLRQFLSGVGRLRERIVETRMALEKEGELSLNYCGVSSTSGTSKLDLSNCLGSKQ